MSFLQFIIIQVVADDWGRILVMGTSTSIPLKSVDMTLEALNSEFLPVNLSFELIILSLKVWRHKMLIMLTSPLILYDHLKI